LILKTKKKNIIKNKEALELKANIVLFRRGVL